MLSICIYPSFSHSPARIMAGECTTAITKPKPPRGRNRVSVTSDAHTVSAHFSVLLGVSDGYTPPRRTPLGQRLLPIFFLQRPTEDESVSQSKVVPSKPKLIQFHDVFKNSWFCLFFVQDLMPLICLDLLKVRNADDRNTFFSPPSDH